MKTPNNKQRGFILGLQGMAMYLVIGLAIGWALTIAGSWMAIWYLDGKVDKAQKEAQQIAKDLGKETTSRKGFEAAAAACTAGVEAVEAEAARKVKDAERAAVVSRAATATAEITIRDILNRPRPQGLDECQATIKELDDEIDRRHPRN